MTPVPFESPPSDRMPLFSLADEVLEVIFDMVMTSSRGPTYHPLTATPALLAQAAVSRRWYRLCVPALFTNVKIFLWHEATLSILHDWFVGPLALYAHLTHHVHRILLCDGFVTLSAQTSPSDSMKYATSELLAAFTSLEVLVQGYENGQVFRPTAFSLPPYPALSASLTTLDTGAVQAFCALQWLVRPSLQCLKIILLDGFDAFRQAPAGVRGFGLRELCVVFHGLVDMDDLSTLLVRLPALEKLKLSGTTLALALPLSLQRMPDLNQQLHLLHIESFIADLTLLFHPRAYHALPVLPSLSVLRLQTTRALNDRFGVTMNQILAVAPRLRSLWLTHHLDVSQLLTSMPAAMLNGNTANLEALDFIPSFFTERRLQKTIVNLVALYQALQQGIRIKAADGRFWSGNLVSERLSQAFCP